MPKVNCVALAILRIFYSKSCFHCHHKQTEGRTLRAPALNFQNSDVDVGQSDFRKCSLFLSNIAEMSRLE